MRVVLCVAAFMLLAPYESFDKKFIRCGLAAEMKPHGVLDLRNCE